MFRFFASGRYDRALALGKTLCEQTIPGKELSFAILLAALSDFFRGMVPQRAEDQEWMNQAIEKLRTINQDPNEFLTILLAFEGSKLFLSDPEKGLAMLDGARKGAQHPAELAAVHFFLAIFELNRSENFEEVLPLLMQVRSGLEGNQEYSLYSFIRFWNETMLAHVSNQVGRFQDSEILSRQILLHCRNLGFEPLIENLYLILAFSHQGLKNKDQMGYYLDQNIDFWEKKKNPYKKGLAMVMAGTLFLQMEDQEKGLDYFQKRKAMDLPIESHWVMIQSALEEAGLEAQAKEWDWK